jgi:uncharacterized membrane protein
MRTASAPAIVSHILSRKNSGHLAKSRLNFMQSEITDVVTKVFAVGELVGDKLPNTPSRTEPLGIIFRCLSGGLVGATICKANGKNAFTGAAIGAAAALGATYGCYFLRKEIVEGFDIYDPWVGAAEDALVIGAGLALIETA